MWSIVLSNSKPATSSAFQGKNKIVVWLWRIVGILWVRDFRLRLISLLSSGSSMTILKWSILSFLIKLCRTCGTADFHVYDWKTHQELPYNFMNRFQSFELSGTWKNNSNWQAALCLSTLTRYSCWKGILIGEVLHAMLHRPPLSYQLTAFKEFKIMSWNCDFTMKSWSKKNPDPFTYRWIFAFAKRKVRFSRKSCIIQILLASLIYCLKIHVIM